MDADPEREITVTCGATEAMISTLLAMVKPGDEVIVFEPFYENYGPDTILADAKPVYVRSSRGSRSTWTGWRRPSAPHPGHRGEHAEQSIRAGLHAARAGGDPRSLRQHDALAVTDEIYEHIRYTGEHIAIATLPGMRERTITISGPRRPSA